MTITLELSQEQERLIEDGIARQDKTVIREVLIEAIDSNVQGILASRNQPSPETRRALLDQLAAEFSDLPPLSEEAMSRESIYPDRY